MWNLRIAGIELYFLLGWFWIYCFLGWIWESCYMSVMERRLINRGFVSGPFLTIYGFGAVSVYLILRPLERQWILLFFCGAVLATVLEYLTAVVLEAVFHTSWWDYTEKKWNFQGKICPESTVCWGCFTLLMFYVLQPGVSWAVRQVDVRTGKVVILVVTVIYGIDFVISAAAAFAMDRKIRKMELLQSELLEILQKNRFSGAAEEIRRRISSFRRKTGEKVRVYPGKARKTMKSYLDMLRTESGQKFESLADYGSEKKSELNLRREQVKAEIRECAERLGIRWEKRRRLIERTIQRFVDAYPHLNHVQRLTVENDGNKEGAMIVSRYEAERSAESGQGNLPEDRFVELRGRKYCLAGNVMTDEKRRASYDLLAQKTFDISFEKWYQDGYWTEKNCPYTLFDGETAAANLSVNRMTVEKGGKAHSCIQIGTVMTDEDYRDQGLMRFLMETVLENIEPSCEMVFLFANRTVLDFYPRFHFQRVGQYRYFWKPEKTEALVKRDSRKRRLHMECEQDVRLLQACYEKKNPFSQLQVTGNFGLLMFYCGSFMKDCVWYLEEEDAVIIAETDQDVLHCYEIYCAPGRTLADLLGCMMNEKTNRVVLEFTPADTEGLEVSPADDDDDALFVWSGRDDLFSDGRFFFPSLFHT